MKLEPQPWKAIKAYRTTNREVQVYRLKKPYDHFGTPIPFVLIEYSWNQEVRRMYCTTKMLKDFWKRWTMILKVINSDREFIERQGKELTLVTEEDKEEKKPPVQPKLRVITGGGNFDDPNWLSYIEEGTTFLAYDKNDPKQIDLERYTLVLKYTKAAWLTLHLVDRDIDPVYVDMLRFSLRKHHVESIENSIR